MRTVLSRRGVIAALAAGAAINVPAIALTAGALPAVSAAPPAVHPDQALLDLGRQYQVALDAEDAACDAWTGAWAAAREAQPVMPDALRHRINDHFEFQFPVLGETEKISDCPLSDFYNETEIAYLRTMPHRTEGGRARADEVILAWDQHHDVCAALAASMGCNEAKAAYREAVAARQAIGDAIVASRATTLQGLAMRAGIVVALIGDDDEPDHLTTDEKMMQAIVRDLARMFI